MISMTPATLAGGAEAPGMPGGPFEQPVGPGGGSWESSEPENTMAIQYVQSAGVDSFHWWRNDSIGGDTYDIDSEDTNVSAPFQLAIEVTGSWDFDVHSATNVYVYTAGVGTSAVSAGTLTLGDGFHVIHNDTSAGGSELYIDVPGPGAGSSSSSSSGSGSGGGAPAPSGSASPLWDEIDVDFGYVEWGMEDGRQSYRFMGNNAASTMYSDLHMPGGTGEMDVLYLGDASCSSLTFPAELEENYVSVSSGHHYIEAGTSGAGPWKLHVTWGPASCEADLTGDGMVDIHDLFALVSSWGSCP